MTASVRTNKEIREQGMNALVDRLGISGTLRFMDDFFVGRGDYTVEKYNRPDEDIDTLCEQIVAFASEK